VQLCTDPPDPAFAYTANGLTVSFQNLTTLAGGYHWDFGDGDTSNLSDPAHTYNDIGAYQVCLTAWNSCGMDSVCQQVEVCLKPVNSFYYYPDGQGVQFYESCMMAEQFYWDFGDGTFSYYSNPYHIYEEQGYYVVCLTTWNECGSDTICDDVDLFVNGVKELPGDGFVVYPNPVKDHFTIRASLRGNVRLQMMDMNGRACGEWNIDFNGGQEHQIYTGSIPDGIYVLYAAGDHTSIARKIIIIH
jgi:hypothetical protein